MNRLLKLDYVKNVIGGEQMYNDCLYNIVSQIETDTFNYRICKPNYVGTEEGWFYTVRLPKNSERITILILNRVINKDEINEIEKILDIN